MQEFLVKYAPKSTKICKNVLKYALNMQKIIFNKMSSFQTKFLFLLILRVFINFTKQFFTIHSNIVKCKMYLCKKYFKSIFILASMLYVLYREALVVQREDACCKCRRTWVTIPPRQNCFLHLTLLERNVKNCFVKLIQTFKINKTIIIKLNILN